MEDERRLKTTEMRMRWCECDDQRWLGHVERMDEERGPVKALLLEVDGTKKGRLKKRWKEVLICDMTARGLQRLDAQDRERWRLGCINQLTSACGEPLKTFWSSSGYE